MRRWGIVVTAGVLAQMGCGFDSGGQGGQRVDPGPTHETGSSDDVTTSGVGDESGDEHGTSASETGTGSGVASDEGDTGIAEASTGNDVSTGMGDSSSDGGEEQTLVDRELVARYFLDESASGRSPDMVLDAASVPLHLPVASNDGLAFGEADTNRGITWNDIEQDGRALVEVAGTKIQDNLNGRTEATIEVIATMSQVSTSGSRLLHIGTAERFDLVLAAQQLDQLTVVTGETAPDTYDTYLEWTVDLTQRVVLHVVYDTLRPVATERVAVYVDGDLAAAGDGTMPDLGAPLSIGADGEIVIGNRNDGNRSFEGTLFYVAIYGAAMTADEVAHNAGLLLQSDDAR